MSMNNYLHINGVALWVALGCVVTFIIATVCLGIGHIYTLKEIGKLKLENELLNRELERGKYSKYKATFKVPEVE